MEKKLGQKSRDTLTLKIKQFFLEPYDSELFTIF